jgi:hypothetical protein
MQFLNVPELFAKQSHPSANTLAFQKLTTLIAGSDFLAKFSILMEENSTVAWR